MAMEKQRVEKPCNGTVELRDAEEKHSSVLLGKCGERKRNAKEWLS